jgi:hypothetical protein
MFCMECGFELQKDAKFCGKCGTKVDLTFNEQTATASTASKLNIKKSNYLENSYIKISKLAEKIGGTLKNAYVGLGEIYRNRFLRLDGKNKIIVVAIPFFVLIISGATIFQLKSKGCVPSATTVCIDYVERSDQTTNAGQNSYSQSNAPDSSISVQSKVIYTMFFSCESIRGTGAGEAMAETLIIASINSDYGFSSVMSGSTYRKYCRTQRGYVTNEDVIATMKLIGSNNGIDYLIGYVGDAIMGEQTIIGVMRRSQ